MPDKPIVQPTHVTLTSAAKEQRQAAAVALAGEEPVLRRAVADAERALLQAIAARGSALIGRDAAANERLAILPHLLRLIEAIERLSQAYQALAENLAEQQRILSKG